MGVIVANTFVPPLASRNPVTETYVIAAKQPNTVRGFEPRSPRFSLNLPVRFFSSEGVSTGECVNVSESGVLVAFDQPVDIWLEGQLTASLADFNISIKARVARVDGRDAGLSFRISSESDKVAVEKLLALSVNKD